MDITRHMSSQEVSMIRSFLTEEFKHKEVTPTELYDKIKNDKKLYNALISVLNQIETISIAIQKGYVDEETIYMALVVLIPYFYDNFTPFIEGKRNQYKDDRIYLELEKLAKSWHANKYLFSGKEIKTYKK